MRKLLAAVLPALLLLIAVPQRSAADDLPRPGELIRHQRWTQAERFARTAAAYATELDSRIVCPVPSAEFVSSFGAPRDGHTHAGNDLMAPDGTVIAAPQSGVYRRHGNDSFYLDATDGTQWFGTHLQGHIAPDGPVTGGQPIALVGHTGNASPDAPHLHLERHPDGGVAVDPYPILNAACHGQPVPTAERAVPQPVYRYNVLEIERWYEARTHTRISGVTARALTRYLNAVTERRLAAYLTAISQSGLVWRWQLVADCESGDDIHAVSPSGYMGWLQFDQASWTANGGSGSPLGQPREVAARVAENYRLRSGTSPWPVCGSRYRS